MIAQIWTGEFWMIQWCIWLFDCKCKLSCNEWGRKGVTSLFRALHDSMVVLLAQILWTKENYVGPHGHYKWKIRKASVNKYLLYLSPPPAKRVYKQVMGWRNIHVSGVYEVKWRTGEMLSRGQLRDEIKRDLIESMDTVERRRAENDAC